MLNAYYENMPPSCCLQDLTVSAPAPPLPEHLMLPYLIMDWTSTTVKWVPSLTLKCLLYKSYQSLLTAIKSQRQKLKKNKKKKICHLVLSLTWSFWNGQHEKENPAGGLIPGFVHKRELVNRDEMLLFTRQQRFLPWRVDCRKPSSILQAVCAAFLLLSRRLSQNHGLKCVVSVCLCVCACFNPSRL